MKRVFSLLLAAMLLFLPVTAFATEETPDVPSPSIKDETVPVIDPVPSSPDASIPEIDISDDGITPEQPNTENNSNETSNNPTDVTETSTDEVSSKESESEAAETEDSDSSEKTSEVTEESEDTSEETEESEEHIHEFTYSSNGDGTHTVTCTAKVRVRSNDTEESEPVYEEVDCTYEEIESCTFDDDGKCIYCGYEEDIEIEFNPTISLSIENQNCEIGKSNPVICLHLSQKKYDVAYAQMCFANYSDDKYINIGLAQGKYYNYENGEFTYISDDGWYASPNITEDLSTGDYSVRSIYIRSTTNEYVHYSLESDTLPDALANTSITVNPHQSIVDEIYESIFETEESESAEAPEPAEIIVDSTVEKPEDETAPKTAMNTVDSREEETESPAPTPTPVPEASVSEPSVTVTPTPSPSVVKPSITELSKDESKSMLEKSIGNTPTVDRPVVEKPSIDKPIEETTLGEKPNEKKESPSPTPHLSKDSKESTQDSKNNNGQPSYIGDIFNKITNFFAKLFRFW